MEIGQTLRETRMRARIDIGEVEARTKIRAKYLRAIENEEWGLLPGPIYVKSFLRTYGDYLGLDSRLLVDEFRRRYEKPSDQEIRPLASISRERERMRRGPRGPLLPPWALIAGVLVIVLVALDLAGSIGHNSTHVTAARPRTGGSSPSGAGSDVTTRTSTTTTVRTSTPVAAPTVASLALKPTGAVWVCVEDAAKKPIVDGVTYTAGQAVPSQRGTVLYVTLGNADVEVTVDGKRYPLSASATAIGLKVTPAGATATPVAPTCT